MIPHTLVAQCLADCIVYVVFQDFKLARHMMLVLTKSQACKSSFDNLLCKYQCWTPCLGQEELEIAVLLDFIVCVWTACFGTGQCCPG